jgi:tRNA 2-selenouridine synthase
VPVQKLPVTDFLRGFHKGLLIDVRSPGEFNHAHIPGAFSLPLFSDEERKLVGTTYKQNSREEAIKIGLDFFGPKMRKMVEKVEKLAGVQQLKDQGSKAGQATIEPKKIFVYCWRGGMRSAGVAWLLDLYGFKVYTLSGGYKAFRNHVLQSFEKPWPFKILGGFTGSGKTKVLSELMARGEKGIDLEAIACHKGSAFGSYQMPPQPTQEMFENLLCSQLDSLTTAVDAGTSIWLEDESQRIGNLNIPNAIWRNMRQSSIFFLDIPFEERLSHLVEEYGKCEVSKLLESTLRISKRLGPLETKNTVAFLEAGDLKEAFRILLRYYDKHYLKGLHNRDNVSALLSKIPCATVSPQNAKLLTKYQAA